MQNTRNYSNFKNMWKVLFRRRMRCLADIKKQLLIVMLYSTQDYILTAFAWWFGKRSPLTPVHLDYRRKAQNKTLFNVALCINKNISAQYYLPTILTMNEMGRYMNDQQVARTYSDVYNNISIQDHKKILLTCSYSAANIKSRCYIHTPPYHVLMATLKYEVTLFYLHKTWIQQIQQPGSLICKRMNPIFIT